MEFGGDAGLPPAYELDAKSDAGVSAGAWPVGLMGGVGGMQMEERLGTPDSRASEMVVHKVDSDDRLVERGWAS